MKICYIFISILLILSCQITYAQILHTESFSVILDTTKWIEGSIIPDLEYQTQKKDLIEFENNTNISFHFNNHAITIANKIEFEKYGKEVLLSGGFLYLEFRNDYRKVTTLEPFIQIHWAEARGLERKYAAGTYYRYRVITKKNLGIFAGLGLFYEYEKWNYDGVDDDLVPENTDKIESSKIKLGDYISFKYQPNENIFLDFSAYHQSSFDQIFNTPRLASSSSITYAFTEHLGITFMYQNIYDYSPVIPIDKLFNKIISSVTISF